MSIYRRLLSKGISTQFVTFNPSRSIIARFPSHGSPSHSHCPAIGPSTPPSRSFHSRRSVSTTSDSERQGQQLNSENMSSDAAAATEAPKPVQDVPDSAKDSKVKAEKGKARSKESKNKEEKSGFQLKVPKGTKDCMSYPPFVNCQIYYLLFLFVCLQSTISSRLRLTCLPGGIAFVNRGGKGHDPSR